LRTVAVLHRYGNGSLLVAATAPIELAFGLAAPANADDGGPYVAIAYSPDNGAHGWANNAWAHTACAAIAVMTPQVTPDQPMGRTPWQE
jgi:hypothetical protein